MNVKYTKSKDYSRDFVSTVIYGVIRWTRSVNDYSNVISFNMYLELAFSTEVEFQNKQKKS